MNYGSVAALPRTCEQRWASWHELHAPIYAAGRPDTAAVRRWVASNREQQSRGGSGPEEARKRIALAGGDPRLRYDRAVRYRTALLRDCPSGPSLDRPVSLTVPGPLLPEENGIRFSRKELLEQVPWWGWLLGGVVLMRAMR
jgi:hypothetical protein